MNKSETIAELAKAMAKAQGEIKGAVKDADNPFFKAKYADLASVWEACREPLTSNGLSVIQSTRMDGHIVVIETMLLHSSGEYITGEIALPPTKSDPQGHGSAITYGRRYTLSAMVGVSPEDDDGNEGSKKDGVRRDETPPPPPPPPLETKPKLPTMQEWAAGFIDRIKVADSQGALVALFNGASKGLASIQKASPELYASIMAADEVRRGDLQFPPDPMADFGDKLPDFG